jgi:hypothetical protein
MLFDAETNRFIFEPGDAKLLGVHHNLTYIPASQAEELLGYAEEARRRAADIDTSSAPGGNTTQGHELIVRKEREYAAVTSIVELLAPHVATDVIIDPEQFMDDNPNN